MTVEDLFGVYVRGLKVEDFQVVEKAYDGKGNLLAEKPVSFVEDPSYKFNGKGFWEKTVNSEKLDIAFFIDGTGSMEKHVGNIRKQIHSFVDRLVEKGTDFRIFIGMYETEGEPEWPISIYQSRFFDVTMLGEIRSAIVRSTPGASGGDNGCVHGFRVRPELVLLVRLRDLRAGRGPRFEGKRHGALLLPTEGGRNGQNGAPGVFFSEGQPQGEGEQLR